jgi:hypothetical protein
LKEGEDGIDGDGIDGDGIDGDGIDEDGMELMIYFETVQ